MPRKKKIANKAPGPSIVAETRRTVTINFPAGSMHPSVWIIEEAGENELRITAPCGDSTNQPASEFRFIAQAILDNFQAP